MEITEFQSLNVGDRVFVVLNTGMTGISEYQYIGVFNSHADNKHYHVFLSPYFLSTCLVSVGNYKNSMRLKNMFKDIKSAEKRKKQLRDIEIANSDY